MNREDIYEPLSRFRDEFREKFSSVCKAYLERLIRESGVDEHANKVLVDQICSLETEKADTGKRQSFWKFILFICILLMAGAVIALIWLFAGESSLDSREKILFFAGCAVSFCAGGYGVFFQAIRRIRHFASAIQSLEERIETLTAFAWEQMEPLNQLFRWETAAELIEQTVPKIQFDPIFTEQRLHDLIHVFGWNNEYNADKSVFSSHSGVLNGNPFVFGEVRKMEWGEKTYTGTLLITWQETVKDSDGHYHTETRTETLTAYVTKPFPVYKKEKILLYGNEAAPDLSFSRTPSELSGQEKGFFNSLKKSRELKSLKKFARNLDDDSNFTMMSNEEFELLFHATDRDDEVQFRLLFTPLAQQQMVNLLNDKQIGYGDDFSFVKECCMNLIRAQHLDDADLNNDPARFRHYNLARIRSFFAEFYESFFKAVYFALAPLLSVPLYQQTRTRETIYGDCAPYKPSFWEYEALANYLGEEHFRHPLCRTECILKTSEGPEQEDGSREIRVTASGYRIEERVESVRVYGQDGSYHWVDVPYDEYLEVESESVMAVAVPAAGKSVSEDKADQMKNLPPEKWKDLYGEVFLRRGVWFCLKNSAKK